jgi:hypothetical protein
MLHLWRNPFGAKGVRHLANAPDTNEVRRDLFLYAIDVSFSLLSDTQNSESEH